MLLQYHDELLNKSISSDYFKDLSFNYVNNSLLLSGLHYPDIPCNDLVITTDKQVKYLNYNTCRIPLPLIYLFNEERNGLKQTVQSHRGRQAIGHSMTYDPSVSMIELRQKILKRLEILYMLALHDNSLIKKCHDSTCESCYKTMFSKYTCIKSEPNIFWLGQILHCIQDSYSRVHTLRMLPGQYTVRSEQPIQTVTDTSSDKLSYKENNIPSFKLVRMIGDIIDRLHLKIDISNSGIQTFLTQEVKEPELKKMIIDNPNDIQHIFKLILFFKNQRKNILDIYGNSDNLPSEKNKNNNESTIENYPYLMSFRYIPHQYKCDRSFHMSYDGAKSSNVFELYVLRNCTDVLNIYKKHLLDNTISINDKINEMITYIARNVFPIVKKYQEQPSAKICSPSPCECQLDYDKVYQLHNTASGGKKKAKNSKKKTKNLRKKRRTKKYQLRN